MREQRPADRGRPGPRPDGRPAHRPASRGPRRVEPALPEDVAPTDLDPTVRRELRSLPKGIADRVAAHLAAAGALVDEDPQAALAHARYARDQASRVAATREAAGIAAYLAGEYAEALADLRAYRRMTGDPQHLPVMADCERGLDRPERALGLARDPEAERLDPGVRVELAIVVSGARRDLGEAEAAVVALQGPELDSDRVQPWTLRLWYAYADALLAAGRSDEARQWFASVAALDAEEETDASERLAELGS